MTPTDRPLGGHHYTDEEMHNEESRTSRGRQRPHRARVRRRHGGGRGSLRGADVRALGHVREPGRDTRPAGVAARGHGRHAARSAPADERAGESRQFRQEEEGKLETYGWVNQSRGVAHVPIEAAKKLLVEHGLPVRSGVRGRSDAWHARTRLRRVVRRAGDQKMKGLFLSLALLALAGPVAAQGLAPDDAGDPAKAKPGLLQQVGIDQQLGPADPARSRLQGRERTRGAARRVLRQAAGDPRARSTTSARCCARRCSTGS